METPNIHIENPAGTYKSFEDDSSPESQRYPLKGVTYPVDYGYADGHEGEDGAELDMFVDSGDLNGFIKVWRLDVPEETKFFTNVTQEELDKIIEAFKPVLISSKVISDQNEFTKEMEKFKVKE